MAECEHCKREMGPEKRSDARFCNAVCKSRAWRKNHGVLMAAMIAANDATLQRIVAENEGILLSKLGMMTDEQLLALRDANKPKQPDNQGK